MEKTYIQIYLNEGNIKKEKSFVNKQGKEYKKVLISFPKLGLLWVSKSQTRAFVPKEKKEEENAKKQLLVVLSANETYSFYKDKETNTNGLLGIEIKDFYQDLWNKKELFVSTSEKIKEIKACSDSEELEQEEIQKEETTQKM